MKIGHVDLDTSHPEAWIQVLRDLGYTNISGVYDSGTVYPKGYANEFARRLGVPQVYDDLEHMAQDVDIAFIHSCNWDLHIEHARPFIDAGKAVFIDKPMAGNMRDMNMLAEWHRKGYRITGGSSLRYCYEIEQFQSKGAAEVGDVQYVFCGAPMDEFNYGIHAYALLQGLLGKGYSSVKHLGMNGQHLVEIEWRDGKKGILSVGESGGFYKTYATIVGRKGTCHIDVDNARIYRAMLEKVMPYLSGDSDEIVPMDELLENEKAALAARESWQNENQRVFLSDLPLQNSGYDGSAFGANYRLQKIR